MAEKPLRLVSWPTQAEATWNGREYSWSTVRNKFSVLGKGTLSIDLSELFKISTGSSLMLGQGGMKSRVSGGVLCVKWGIVQCSAQVNVGRSTSLSFGRQCAVGHCTQCLHSMSSATWHYQSFTVWPAWIRPYPYENKLFKCDETWLFVHQEVVLQDWCQADLGSLWHLSTCHGRWLNRSCVRL